MEELNSQTMNLGGLNNKVIPPVTNLGYPATTVSPDININPINTTYINSQPTQVTFNQTTIPVQQESQEVNQTTAQEASTVQNNEQSISKEPIVSEKFEVDVGKLQEMTSNAINIAVRNPRVQLTTVLQLKFSALGFQILAFDKENYLFQTDTTRTYTRDFSFGVDAAKFSAFVSKLDPGIVEMEYHADTKVIDLITPYGNFKFPEVYDNSTGEVCNFVLDPIYTNADLTFKSFSAQAFQSVVKNIFPFATEFEAKPETSGVYCGSVVSATDKNILGLQKNVTDLVNDKFYLSNKLAKVIQNIKLVEDKENPLQIGFIKNSTGRVERIIFKNKYMILAGPAKPEDSFESQFDSAVDLYTKAVVGSSTVFMKARLSAILDRVSIFINENTDSGFFNFTVNNGIIDVKTLSENLHENLPTKSDIYNLPQKRLVLQYIKNALKALNGDEITLGSSNEIPNGLCFTSEDTTVILTVSE